MTVKSEVLRTLEENRGISFSGEALAERLGISRAAVWKAITSLRNEGYEITAGTNRGYLLAQSNDLLSEEGIRHYLSDSNRSLPLHVFKVLESTNLTAKKLALEGAVHGTAVIANQQTKGRGRLGRSFYSPPSSGIYLSILLKPNFDISKSVLVTTAASVAVARAVKNICNIEAQIKWVNDVYVNNLKICGILTEAVTDFESGNIEYIALGIGVNCCMPESGFPEDLSGKVGSLNLFKGDESSCDEGSAFGNFSRNSLIGEIINQVMSIYENIENREFISEYRERSLLLGREIQVIKGGSSASSLNSAKDSSASARDSSCSAKESSDFSTDSSCFAKASSAPSGLSAIALDIDNDGCLLVEYEDGTREVLNTGEISIRL